MPINDFKPFAAGPGANVTSQADWENLPALLTGFMSGKASSAQMNKAFRQASFIAAALAQFVSEKTDQDVLDDGDLPGFVEKLTAGFAAQYLSRSNPFGDIASDGAEAIATALANLRLGAGAPAIGIPFFWPSSAMPNTVIDEWSDMVFLKPNGASFSAATYPKLAKVWTGLVIPDMRGEFPRIWDDGRGVDSGRALLSSQSSAAPDITAGMDSSVRRSSDGALLGTLGNLSGAIAGVGDALPVSLITSTDGSLLRYIKADFKASRSSSVYQAVSEIRPSNRALNFLVRAK